MNMPTPAVKCPACLGENIEPRGDQWYCRDCDKMFDIAGAVLPKLKPMPPKRISRRRR